MITVKIKDKLNESLEYNGAATDFLDELNEYPDDEIKVDFTGIIFMSRSFAQEYYGKKSISGKDIEDINVPEDVQLMLNIAENNLKRRLG
ncbi:hypothetical protein [uncultured Methanobrevibacter sp.]|uniref:hypothetical protein n=1 Tax=uncultured Methanobrevibacter sp. TaxID=253161 RepID=UPI0026DEC5B2|nr:hypothetical protein [uncultured Methanobrevibacter sp.]